MSRHFTVVVSGEFSATATGIEASSPVVAEDEAIQQIEDWLAECPFDLDLIGHLAADSSEEDEEV